MARPLRGGLQEGLGSAVWAAPAETKTQLEISRTVEPIRFKLYAAGRADADNLSYSKMSAFGYKELPARLSDDGRFPHRISFTLGGYNRDTNKT